MKTITVNTGFGYFTKDGKIHSKAELPVGEHPAGDEYIYHEVPNKQTLDIVEVYQEPYVPTAEELREQKIQAKMRKMAEDELNKEGKL